MGNTPMSNCRKEDSMRGVKLIWPHMNRFCSHTEIFSVQKFKMNYLAAELTRYHLEVILQCEAKLRRTNPKEIRFLKEK